MSSESDTMEGREVQKGKQVLPPQQEAGGSLEPQLSLRLPHWKETGRVPYSPQEITRQMPQKDRTHKEPSPLLTTANTETRGNEASVASPAAAQRLPGWKSDTEAEAETAWHRQPSLRVDGLPAAGITSAGDPGSLMDHVLGIPYSDVREVYSVSRQELGRGQFGIIRTCMKRVTGALYACKSIAKTSIQVSGWPRSHRTCA